jgi:general secretion pathway protein M
MTTFKLPDISFKHLTQLKEFKSFQLSLATYFKGRERVALVIAGAAVVIFLVLQVIIFPAVGRRDSLRKQIVFKTEALQEIRAQKTEYQRLSQNTKHTQARIQKRAKTFTLFSYIDQLAGKSGIKGNIASMKPSTTNIKNSSFKLSSVEMKLNSLTMEQLTTFLHGLEDPKNVVWIKRISISKADKNEGLLNAVLQTETYQR